MTTITKNENNTNYSPTFPVFPHNAKAITGSDTDEFEIPVAVFCEVSGNIAVVPFNSSTSITLSSVPAYYTIPFMVKQVLSTGTTATGLVAVF